LMAAAEFETRWFPMLLKASMLGGGYRKVREFFKWFARGYTGL
jgi:hypothetical protein